MKETIWRQRMARMAAVIERSNGSKGDYYVVLVAVYNLLDEVKAFGSQAIANSAWAALQDVARQKGWSV